MAITSRRAAVAVTAVRTWPCAPVIGFDPPEGPDPLITPTPATFAAWTPIVAASLAYGIDQARPSGKDAVVLDEIAVPVAPVFAGFSVWLASARGASAAAGAAALNGHPAYVLASLWALAGIAVGAARRDARGLSAIACGAAALVAGLGVAASRRRGRRRGSRGTTSPTRRQRYTARSG